VVLGLVGLLVVYGIYTGALPSGLPPPPPPPKGVLIQVPVVNAAAFFLPVIAVMSVLLIAVGLKRGMLNSPAPGTFRYWTFYASTNLERRHHLRDDQHPRQALRRHRK
jgi:hypothetical protein